ncbi:putative membrane-anchored protein [Rhodococcus sp. LBL1]|nr:putative membrane-anchored protein [Rhodococcus sp. LBL1]MDH6684466.1 putative membrane-anchored protein [Rhodococcus sp. LBL2]
MHNNVLPPQPSGVSGRAVAALAAISAMLVGAFVAAPPVLASAWSGRSFGNQDDLVAAARVAFVDYWASGGSDLSPGLQAVGDYWARFHVVKAVIATLALATVAAFGILLGRRYVTSGSLGADRRAVLATAGVFTAMLAVVSAAAVMANIQGALVPFSSLLSLVPVGESGGELADTVDQIGQRLADGQRTQALEAMIGDFGDYHAVMAVIAVCAAAAVLGLSALSWTRFVRVDASDRRTRRVLGWVGVVTTVAALALVVVAVANAGTAADPAPALAAFFDGAVL